MRLHYGAVLSQESEMFPKRRDLLSSEGFFLAATFVLLLTSKNWPGLATTTSSELYCQNFGFLFFSRTSLLRLM